MRAALLADDGHVDNVIELPDGFDGDSWDGLQVRPLSDGESVSPGDRWDGQEWQRPAPSLPPDPRGFLRAARDQLGKSNARKVLSAYPDIALGLRLDDWETMRDAIDDAHTNGDLTDRQHDTVLTLLDEHGIPDPEAA